MLLYLGLQLHKVFFIKTRHLNLHEGLPSFAYFDRATILVLLMLSFSVLSHFFATLNLLIFSL